ncbi:MAG: ABC transporter permease [Terriglobia bacterium]|jgi:putative ABC transport system permease protein
MRTLRQYLKYGLRMLAKNPGFTAVAVLTLALGIGANTAIFSAVNALLLNPYPFHEPDRIMDVDARHVSGKNNGVGYRDFLDWRDQNDVFEEMAITGYPSAYTWTGQGEPQQIVGGVTTSGFLKVLGIQPVLGRFYTAEEDKLGAARVAVLSYAAWQRRYAGNADILGRTMTLDGTPFTIVGVLPASFALPGIKTCEFFTALREDPARDRMQHQYSVIARLKPGITVERAQADMTTIARRLEQEFPATNTGWGVKVQPIRNALLEGVQKPVLLLFAAVGFVLLLACVNIAGLQLARASVRGKEMAIRASLGAGRGRIIRQMLTESVLLALAGGGLGLVIAHWLMDVLRSTAPEDFALDSTLRMDPHVLFFTLLVSVITGIGFGIAPAWFGSRTDLNCAIKGAANAWSGARRRNRLMSFLVVGEAGLCLVLLVGAGLIVKDLFVLLHVETGLRVDRVLTFTLDPPSAKYSTPERSVGLYQELLSRLRAVPGVDGAAAVGTLPMTGEYSGGPFEIEGRPKPADWMDMDTQYNESTPDYFRTMGIPLLRGRDFDERDTANSLPVTLINDTLARRYFQNEDPIGRRIKLGDKWHTIVGIVGSIKHQQPMRAPVPMVYAPHAQWPGPYMWVTVHTTGDTANVAAAVRGIVHNLDGDIPVLSLRTMRKVVADSLSEPALMASFLASFAVFALLLAAIGVYGITSYSVTQRMHEMGIRIALGASRGNVFELILRRGALLACAGVTLGIPAALALSRVMGSMLFGIGPRDLVVFAGMPVLLVLVALAASYFPAHRAAKVDPMVALRYE